MRVKLSLNFFINASWLLKFKIAFLFSLKIPTFSLNIFSICLATSNSTDFFSYSIFLSNSFNSKITGFLEFYGDWNYNSGIYNSIINFDFGGSYLLNDKMQLDAYFGKGLNNDLYFGSIGFSYLFIK